MGGVGAGGVFWGHSACFGVVHAEAGGLQPLLPDVLAALSRAIGEPRSLWKSEAVGMDETRGAGWGGTAGLLPWVCVTWRGPVAVRCQRLGAGTPEQPPGPVPGAGCRRRARRGVLKFLSPSSPRGNGRGVPLLPGLPKAKPESAPW